MHVFSLPKVHTHSFLVLTFLIVMATGLGAQTPNVARAQDVLKQSDQLVTFMDSDFTAQYQFVQDVPGEGKVYKTAIIFRRDRENKYLIVMKLPEVDKGKGYLKVDNNLWFYDPESRRATFTSARDRFQNLNARNSDFTRSNLGGDYQVTKVTPEKLGRFDCWVLDLESTTDEVTFPRMKVWLSSADSLVRQTKDYSLSGQHLRTTAIPQYQKVGSRYIPTNIIIVDILKGKNIAGSFVSEKTQITISQPSLVDLPQNTFTQAYLEKLNG